MLSIRFLALLLPFSLLYSEKVLYSTKELEESVKDVGEIQRKSQEFQHGKAPELSTRMVAPPPKNQITYLMQVGEVEKSVQSYYLYKRSLKKHDFEVLQQMAFILLDHGARSTDMQTQLCSIYGSVIGNALTSLDILEAGVKSTHAETQLASIKVLGQMQDDRSDELLLKAMSSEFFFARMEAALFLAQRKHRASVGQIESLMFRVPGEARFFFPQFFALIGNKDAMAILRHLMEDPHSTVRVEAILSAARFGRDDLLPSIRKHVTHLDMGEQEAAAYAIGLLKDSKSIKKLKQLFTSSSPNVQITAAHALYTFGDLTTRDFLLEKARELNLFAIVSLSDIPEAKDLLASLCTHPDLTIRINAGMALLKLRDRRCLKPLMEILLRDTRDMGFQPQMSVGKTMMALKPVFSISQQKNTFFDVKAATLAIREQFLTEAMHLSEEDFLQVAEEVINNNQSELIPAVINLLQSLQTPEAIALLKKKAHNSSIPLARAYSNLALYRLNQEGAYETYLREWIIRNKETELIQFKPLVPIDKKVNNASKDLTPEDYSRLMIEIYQALAEKQKDLSLNLLLDAIRDGNKKNRPVLAGLLLRALQ